MYSPVYPEQDKNHHIIASSASSAILFAWAHAVCLFCDFGYVHCSISLDVPSRDWSDVTNLGSMPAVNTTQLATEDSLTRIT